MHLHSLIRLDSRAEASYAEGEVFERLYRRALIASVLLHLSMVMPMDIPHFEKEMEEDPGDIEDTAAELVAPVLSISPFAVTILEESPAAPAKELPPEPPAPPAPPKPPEPPKPPVPPKEEDQAGLVPPKPPEPPEVPPETSETTPEVPPEVPPEVLNATDAELVAQAEAEAALDGEDSVIAPETDDNGEAFEEAKSKTKLRNKPPPRPKTKLPPCPAPIPEITMVNATTWSIERELIDYYASHLSKLYELARVWLHRSNGVPDGFRIALSRCSILRQAGFRSGDVIHSVDDRRIYTVLQAVGAYWALRTKPSVEIQLTRSGKPLTFVYQIEPRFKRKSKK